MESLICNPIGIIYSPYKEHKQAPRQGRNESAICEIEIFERYAAGLEDIDGFSHLILVYWFNRSEGYSLSVKTPWDQNSHGVFATRSPHRPNPIAICTVELLSHNGRSLKVKWLDALDKTPLLDIKPYMPGVDAVTEAHSGWLTGKI